MSFTPELSVENRALLGMVAIGEVAKLKQDQTFQLHPESGLTQLAGFLQSAADSCPRELDPHCSQKVPSAPSENFAEVMDIFGLHKRNLETGLTRAQQVVEAIQMVLTGTNPTPDHVTLIEDFAQKFHRFHNPTS